jgi:hypothetical protein
MRFLVEDQEKLRINKIGYSLDQRYCIIDRGGP